jgi:NAD(P)-dependent dehydrogenase (short-subunit alcohol dehydrogenase family)
MSSDTDCDSGLGFEAALQLAELKPKTLVLTVRDPAKNPDLADKIKAKYPDLDVRVWALELSSYASIKAFAKKAEAELNTLDLLLNNAGCVETGSSVCRADSHRDE